MALFLLPLGPSYNLDIAAYDPENIYLLRACSGKASSTELGGRCLVLSYAVSPLYGYHSARFLCPKKSTGCWLCITSYRFKARIPKYVQLGMMTMVYEMSYNTSYKESVYSWPWYLVCFEQSAYRKATSVVCTSTSLTLLSAIPTITIWMR